MAMKNLLLKSFYIENECKYIIFNSYIVLHCSRRIMVMGHYLLGRSWGVGLRKVKK